MTHHPQHVDLALRQIATLKMALQPPLFPQKINPRLLQLCEWEESRTDAELPQHVIRYTIKWKVKKVNNRFRSEDAEPDVPLTPSAYWPSVLKGKLEKVLPERISRNRQDQVL